MDHERIDSLIDAVVSGNASTAQWNELVAIAETTPSIWRDLAQGQRQERALAATMDRAVRIADAVDVPPPAPVFRFPGQWVGWAVAAALALAWALGVRLGDRVQPLDPKTQVAGAGYITSSDAFRQYIERGRDENRVVQEVPTFVLVQTRRKEDGAGFEVLYLRQILERTEVPDLYHFHGQDEAGQPALVRYEPPVRRPM